MKRLPNYLLAKQTSMFCSNQKFDFTCKNNFFNQSNFKNTNLLIVSSQDCLFFLHPTFWWLRKNYKTFFDVKKWAHSKQVYKTVMLSYFSNFCFLKELTVFVEMSWKSVKPHLFTKKNFYTNFLSHYHLSCFCSVKATSVLKVLEVIWKSDCKSTSC